MGFLDCGTLISVILTSPGARMRGKQIILFWGTTTNRNLSQARLWYTALLLPSLLNVLLVEMYYLDNPSLVFTPKL